ncbi:MAG: hypothetical protein ACE5FB_01970 [Candidatus Binatia bacterium]
MSWHTILKAREVCGIRRRSGGFTMRTSRMGRNEQQWYGPAKRCERLREGLGRLAGIGMLSLVVVFSPMAAGCGNIRIRMGNRPDTDVLEESLRLEESTRADVLAVLGLPHGKGRTMLPFDTKSRTIWSYYYEEGDLKDARRMFLFVYFDQDRYDGYMWFSSLPK